MNTKTCFEQLRTSLLLVALMIVLGACSDTERARENMQSAMQQQAESKQILEFFMYTCPHCKAVEPAVKEWQAKQSILFQQGIYSFEQVPAVFPANWLKDGKVGEREAAIFYAFKRMGLEPQLRMKVFAAIQDKSLDASDNTSISQFLKKEGVPYTEFVATIKSDHVRKDVQRAEQLTLKYAVYSVPAFVLFNRTLILSQDFKDLSSLQFQLLQQVKNHYQSQKAAHTAQSAFTGVTP